MLKNKLSKTERKPSFAQITEIVTLFDRQRQTTVFVFVVRAFSSLQKAPNFDNLLLEEKVCIEYENLCFLK